MSRRVQIQLINGWSDYSNESPDGIFLFLTDSSETPGPLQVSLTQYVSGEVPDPSEQDLIELSKKTGYEQGFGELVGTHSGACEIGKFGSAIFSSNEYSRIQIWYLSDGENFVLVTHIGADDLKEIDEAQEIVNNITLVERAWWKIW